jgi:hypothetical protein
MYSERFVRIHEPNSISPKNTQIIFGTNVSVCSCMDVTVWKILTTSPTTSETRSSGAAQMMIM